MLAKENRLKKNKDFQTVFKKGKSLAGRYIVIYWMPNYLDVSRFGFSVSKKVGGAVYRNRIKRVLRAILFREEKLVGFDIIVIVRPKIKGVSTTLVEKDLKKVLSKAGLY